MRRLLHYGFLLLCCAALPASAQTVVNPQFEQDVPFTIPTGWTTFGDCKFEGGWDGDWKAQLGNVLPRHEAGFYQAVRVSPGTRYRLTVQTRVGHPQLQAKVGLASRATVDTAAVAWSPVRNENSYGDQTVEAVTETDVLIILLHVFNTNNEFMFLETVRFDHVRLAAIGNTATPTPVPAQPFAPPPAHDVYANNANLWTLAWPKPGVRTFLAGTHDPNMNSNADYDRVEGTIVDDGQTWSVLKTFTGPGALTRIWMTNFRVEGQIRIYVDGNRVVDGNIRDFFGSTGVFRWPLANRNTGSWHSYVPIPFNNTCRVQVRNAEQFRYYWQITYQQFDSAPGLRPFTQPLNGTDAAHLRRIQDQWGAASFNPKPPLPNTQTASGTVSVPAGQTVTLHTLPGAGIIDAVWIDPPAIGAGELQGLRLEMAWDGAATPQVNAPLGLFFGVGYHEIVSRGLLNGMTPAEGGYCYYPLPFSEGAVLRLRNNTAAAVNNIAWRIRYAPMGSPPPMRCHADFIEANPAGQSQLYELLNLTGDGHLVASSHAMRGLSGNPMEFLEGDEYLWVDGETSPSTAGTGTEDYFTCGWYFQDGPASFPAFGAPLVDRPANRVSAYRTHVPDWVPFRESLRFALEVGDTATSSISGDYESVVFYYLNEGPAPTKEAHLKTY